VSESNELQRYRVYRIGAIYAVLAWLLGQLLLSFSGRLPLDESTVDLIIVSLVFGFVPVVIISWMFARRRQAKQSDNTTRND
jgi:hypothetical protein